jgi:hypothetical protein
MVRPKRVLAPGARICPEVPSFKVSPPRRQHLVVVVICTPLPKNREGPFNRTRKRMLKCPCSDRTPVPRRFPLTVAARRFCRTEAPYPQPASNPSPRTPHWHKREATMCAPPQQAAATAVRPSEPPISDPQGAQQRPTQTATNPKRTGLVNGQRVPIASGAASGGNDPKLATLSHAARIPRP